MRTNQTAHACVTGSCDAAYEYPSTARAARHAARTWFETASDIASAQYRDQQFIAHCEGKPDSTLERKIRRHAFRQAYAEAIGHIVVEEARFPCAPCLNVRLRFPPQPWCGTNRQPRNGACRFPRTFRDRLEVGD